MLIDDFLTRTAARLPDKVACVVGGRRLTYAEYETASNRLAHALIDAGIQPGDRVAVFMENRVEVPIAMFGILKAGAAFVVINATTKPDKLCYILNDCRASAVILNRRSQDAIDAIVSRVDSVRCLITRGDLPPEVAESGAAKLHYLDFDKDVAAFPTKRPGPRRIDMDLSAIVYTSGSTGRPKGVIATHRSMMAAAMSIVEYLENVEEDIVLNVLPLSFTYGLYHVLMMAYLGATLVLEQSFAYPFQVVQRLRQERVTGFPGVPTMFAVLTQMKGIEPADLDTVRYVTNAGAALPVAHLERLRGLFRKARIFSMYGLTECVRVSYLQPEELDQRPDSVGTGMPNQQVDVVDEDGVPLPPGQVGELTVRGSHVMKGYWDLPEETARVLRPSRSGFDNVLYTGDLFRMDEQGYLYFVSRKDDIIKSRGEKVSPREVENVICELPEVLEVAVIGVPDDVLGEAVKAIVVLAEGATLGQGDVVRHCGRRLESFMVPRYVEFRDCLPKTDTGKIKRAVLREEGVTDTQETR